MRKKFKGKSYPKIEVKQERHEEYSIFVNGEKIETLKSKEAAERRAAFYDRCYRA